MRYDTQKTKLEEQLAFYNEELRASREAVHETERGDEGDIAAAMSRKSFAMSRHASNKTKIAAIDAALNRITAGTYGKCMDCGDEIEPKRLLAMPTALTCMGCC